MSLTRLAGAWAMIALAMSANGVIREAFIKPAVGSGSAEIISAMTGIAIVLIMTMCFLRPLAGRPHAELLRASATLVVLTVAFELVVGLYVDGKSWMDLLNNYAIWEGRLWPIVLLVVALSPFIWGRWRVEGRAHAR